MEYAHDPRTFLFSHYIYRGLRSATGSSAPRCWPCRSWTCPAPWSVSMGALCTSLMDLPSPLNHKFNEMLASVLLVHRRDRRGGAGHAVPARAAVGAGAGDLPGRHDDGLWQQDHAVAVFGIVRHDAHRERGLRAPEGACPRRAVRGRGGGLHGVCDGGQLGHGAAHAPADPGRVAVRNVSATSRSRQVSTMPAQTTRSSSTSWCASRSWWPSASRPRVTSCCGKPHQARRPAGARASAHARSLRVHPLHQHRLSRCCARPSAARRRWTRYGGWCAGWARISRKSPTTSRAASPRTAPMTTAPTCAR